MMFITPMPPTSSEIAAMTEMAMESLRIMLSTDSMTLSMLMDVTR